MTGRMNKGALMLVALFGCMVATGGAGEPLTGYAVEKSVVMNYSDTGWGGWSVPAGKIVTGGGFELTGSPAAASAPAVLQQHGHVRRGTTTVLLECRTTEEYDAVQNTQ